MDEIRAAESYDVLLCICKVQFSIELYSYYSNRFRLLLFAGAMLHEQQRTFGKLDYTRSDICVDLSFR